MNKRLEISSKSLVSQFHCQVPWIVVSISRQFNDWPWVSEENRVGLLQVVIQEINDEHDWFYKNCCLAGVCDRNKAIQILDFVHKYWDQVGVILIQCESGQCCASAVAAACAYIHERGSEKCFIERYHTNWFIYKMLLKAHYDRHGWYS